MGERVAVKRDRGRERERGHNTKGKVNINFCFVTITSAFPKRRKREIERSSKRYGKVLGVSWRLQFLPFSHFQFQSRTISFFVGKRLSIPRAHKTTDRYRGGREGKKGLRPNIPQLFPLSHIPKRRPTLQLSV